MMAEVSLTPYCWLLFAPRIRHHLGKIIPWSKEDREVRERRRLGLWTRVLSKFPRWTSSYLGNAAPIVALAGVISRGLGSISIALGSSYSFWQHVHVTANITGVQLPLFTFLSTPPDEQIHKAEQTHSSVRQFECLTP